MGNDARLTAEATALDRVPLPSFYNLIHLARTESTNDEAKRLAAEGAADGTLIWADSQTAGRGRRGRLWQSPPGNLYISIILRPGLPVARLGQVGFAAALAIFETAASLLPPNAVVRCKWPNDVLIDGRKTAGLLLETDNLTSGTAAWMVLGVGINIASHPADTEFPATSLAAAGGTADVVTVLSRFAERFAVWYETWRGAGFAPLRAAWLARAAGLGEVIHVRLENCSLDGVFAGLDADGALLLHDAGQGPDGSAQRITAGDVFFPTTIRTEAG